MPFGSSERAGQLTSRPPTAPLVTESTRPLPPIRSPRHVTSALRSVATRFSLRLFLLHARARLRHHFDYARVRVFGLEREDFLQRADRDLDLIERRLARREPLQPHPRRQQGHQDPVVLMFSRKADQLVGDACDHRQQEDPRRDQPVPVWATEEREHEDRDHHHPEQEGGAAAGMDLAEALNDLGLELLPGLVGVDRLVLRGVVLEDAPQIREQRDQRQVEDEDRDTNATFDDYEPACALDPDPVGDQRGRNLEEQDGEPDRDRKREDQLCTRELGGDFLTLFALLRFRHSRIVRRDGECAKTDRQRLAERDYSTDHRQPEDQVPRHRRLDRLVYLRDVSVRLADSHGPVRGAAHHHALQDGLSPNVRHLALAAACAAGLLEPALEALDASARVDQLLLARVERVAAPATSQASFIRPYMKRNASSRASSVTSTESTPSSMQTRTQFAPAYGPLRPSAIDFASTVTGSPAFRLSCSAGERSGSTAITRAPGRSALTAVAIPETSPPPPTWTRTRSASGRSSRISRPTVPWPAITSGSSYGWTSVRPV